jgi:hypothetical protein
VADEAERKMALKLLAEEKIKDKLLKLGIEVAQSTVSIYMVPREDRPLTVVRNQMEGLRRSICSWFRR